MASQIEKTVLKALKQTRPAVYPIVAQLIEVFEDAARRSPRAVSPIYNQELISVLTDLVERSAFYENLYDYWRKKLGSTDDKVEYSFANAIHLFSAILLQEIEGPLKIELQIANFLMEIANGNQAKWPDYQYKKGSRGQTKGIDHIVTRGLVLSVDYREIFWMFRAMKGGGDYLPFKLLRNVLGHSTYQILSRGGRIVVMLKAGKLSREIEAREYLSVLTGVQDLIRGLHVGVYLILRKTRAMSS